MRPGMNITTSLPSNFSPQSSLPSAIALSQTIPGDIDMDSVALPDAFATLASSLPNMGQNTFTLSETEIDDALTNAKNFIDVDVADDDSSGGSI